MIKTIIEVEISDLKVDAKYYSFDYKVIQDGEVRASGRYDSDHVWDKQTKEFKIILEKYYAVELALQKVF